MKGSNLPPFLVLLVLRANSLSLLFGKGVSGEEGCLCWFRLVAEQSATVSRDTEHKRGLFLVTPFPASSTHVPALRVTHGSTEDNSQDQEDFCS